MERDAFSSTQQKTSESDNPTRTWSRTTSDIQLWDVSRRLRELTCFTLTLTQLPPQDWVPSSPFATMQKTNMRMKSLKTTGQHSETWKSPVQNPSWNLLPCEQLLRGGSPEHNSKLVTSDNAFCDKRRNFTNLPRRVTLLITGCITGSLVVWLKQN